MVRGRHAERFAPTASTATWSTRANQTAIIWEPDDPRTPARHITYAQLLENTCRMANVLKSHGVKKGDRVVIFTCR